MRYLLFIICFLPSIVFAQQLEVSSSAEIVYTFQPFDVSFQISNADNASFSPPKFSPFSVIAGPFTSNNISIINGRKSSSTTYTYRLVSEKAGTFKIPATSMVFKNKTIRSKPLSIEVKKGTKENMLKGKELFLEMNLADSTIYVGQQLIIDHQLYFGSQRISGVNLIGDFPTDRFLVNRISELANRATQVEYKGELLNKVHVSRLGLFPLRSGEMVIPKTVFEVEIQKDNNRRRGFFSFFEGEKKVVSVPSKEIMVKPLPSNAPKNFTGAVGKLSIKLDTERNQSNNQEEIIVRATLQGNGIADQVELKASDFPGFKIFEPKLLNSEKYILDKEIHFKKIYQLIVVPEENGNLSFKLPYSYFDPHREIYVDTFSNVIRFQNYTGSGTKQDATSKDLSFESQQSNSSKLWIYGLLTLALAGILAYFFNNKKKNPPIVQTVNKEKLAKEIAIEKLSSAKELLDNKKTEKYWETLENAIQMYLEEKLNLSTTQFKKETVKTKWKEQNLPENAFHTWEGFNDSINLARYAGQNIDQMEKIYQDALIWIQEIEKN